MENSDSEAHEPQERTCERDGHASHRAERSAPSLIYTQVRPTDELRAFRTPDMQLRLDGDAR